MNDGSEAIAIVLVGPRFAGRSLLLQRLEEAGRAAVDNLPPRLLEACLGGSGPEFKGGGSAENRGLAVAVDTEDPGSVPALEASLGRLSKSGVAYRLVYIGASEAILRERREASGIAPETGGRDGALARATELSGLRARADLILDSSFTSPRELLLAVLALVGESAEPVETVVDIASFGFKYGQAQGDLVVDVRFIRNPYYVAALRPLTGRDKACADYVLAQAGARETVSAIASMARAMLPALSVEGRHSLRIRIGCTGGQHRSVAIAEAVAALLKAEGRPISLRHAEIEAGRCGQTVRTA